MKLNPFTAVITALKKQELYTHKVPLTVKKPLGLDFDFIPLQRYEPL